MASGFTQTLPGEGLISQLLKPTFLQWDAERAACIFGKCVMVTLQSVARDVSLSVAGVLGRPLYVCTQLKPDGDICRNVAAMSPLVERAGGRRTFRCKLCQSKDDDVALRMIRLYILVSSSHASAGQTPLRTKSLHILLYAPPVDYRWGAAEHPAESIAGEANPERGYKEFQYSQEGSLTIWQCARPYHQALPVHVPSRLLEANSAQAQELRPMEIDEKVAEILRQCLETHRWAVRSFCH